MLRSFLSLLRVCVALGWPLKRCKRIVRWKKARNVHGCLCVYVWNDNWIWAHIKTHQLKQLLNWSFSFIEDISILYVWKVFFNNRANERERENMYIYTHVYIWLNSLIDILKHLKTNFFFLLFNDNGGASSLGSHSLNDSIAKIE